MNRHSSTRGNHRCGRHQRSQNALGSYVVAGLAAVGATAMVAAPVPPAPSDINVQTFRPSNYGRHRKRRREVRPPFNSGDLLLEARTSLGAPSLRTQSAIKPPTSRPVSRRRHRKPRPAGHPRFAATVAIVGVTAAVGASFASPPSVEARRVQLSAASSAATPNQLLAALVETGRGLAATFYPSTVVTPADLSAAIAAIVDGHTTAVLARMAGGQADPIAVNAGDITLWVIPLVGLGGSTANAGWAVNYTFGGPDGGTIDASSALQTANQLGPLAFFLNNLGTISFSNTPDPTAPAGNRPVFNAGNMTTWLAGLAGLASSTGTVGWTVNNTFGSGDGGIADATGILRTANQLGPMVFNLNVLKSMTFTQAPNGTTLPNGQLDTIRAVDIGQWVVGIPGIFANTGTVGFVADFSSGVGNPTFGWIGGLQTTTQIGPFTFTFNFLPAIGFGAPPPTMTPFPSGPSTAAVTTFASDPPPVNVTSSTGTTSVGEEMTAFGAVETQPIAEPSEGSASVNTDAGNEADAVGGDTPATDAVESTEASPSATTTVPAAATETSPVANGPAETTKPADTTTPNADSNPDGTQHSAAASASPSASSPNGDTGKHEADNGHVGRHRTDDGYIGKHRSDDGSPSSQTSSGTDDSESAA